MRELAAAAAWADTCSLRATLEVRSSLSVDSGVLEVCGLSETELSEGESRSVGRAGGLFGTGGARFFPLPSTLPPPRLLLAAMVSYAFVTRDIPLAGGNILYSIPSMPAAQGKGIGASRCTAGP